MTGPCYVVATGSPAAELVLLQVVGGVNEENAGRELGVGCIRRCRGEGSQALIISVGLRLVKASTSYAHCPQGSLASQPRYKATLRSCRRRPNHQAHRENRCQAINDQRQPFFSENREFRRRRPMCRSRGFFQYVLGAAVQRGASGRSARRVACFPVTNSLSKRLT
jgi:hypothetical protein